MIFVEPRAVTRWYHEWVAVLVALILTLLTASVLLAAIGLDPPSSLYRIFIKPLNSVYGISELLAKATPLITIGVALALGFRAGVWNIGAEGQLVMGGTPTGQMDQETVPTTQDSSSCSNKARYNKQISL